MRKIAKVVFCITILIIPSLVLGEVYKWVDENGGVHFTYDYSTIPEKYRQIIEKGTLQEDSSSKQREERPNKIEVKFEIKKLMDQCAVLMDMGKVDDTIALLLRVIKSDPNYAAAYRNLGAVYYQKGQLDKGVEATKKAIELNPNDKTAHSNLGNTYTDLKRYDEAIAEHKKVIELDPRNAEAFTNVGVALSQKGDIAEGLIQFQKAVSINPYHPLARMNLGITYQHMKKWPEAIDEFLYARDIGLYPDVEGSLTSTLQESFPDLEQWTRNEPNEPLFHYYLAYALAYKEDWQRAMSEINRAIELDRTKGKFHKAKARFYSSQGSDKEAIAACKDCIAADPLNWACYNLLSEMNLIIGNREEGLKAAIKANDIDPNLINTQWCLGTAYGVKGEYQKAIVAFQKALSLGGRNPELHFNLAAAYFNLKNYEMAWRHATIAQRTGSKKSMDLIQILRKVSKEPLD